MVELAVDPRSNPAVKQIFEIARERDFTLYIVGGYIRDCILARERAGGSHKDYDFMVMPGRKSIGKAVEFAQVIAEKLDAHFVLLDESNDTARVVTDSLECFDFAGCVGGTLESDMKRRDFSINALAWGEEHVADEPSYKVIDLVDGICDIEKRKVRAISEQSFIDDPLRLLRAYRFAALLDFDIEEGTLAHIHTHKEAIKNVAAERVSSELFLMLETPRAGKQIKEMGDNGLLEAIFPELLETRRVTANAFHHLPLFDHSVESLVQAEASFQEMPDWAQKSMKEPLSVGVSRYAATKLAALIHDIGKPDTWVITDEGKHTFIGHDKLGAEMCDPLSKRLKWSNPVSHFVEKLVRWHLRPGHLFHQGPPTDKAKFKFYRTIGPELPELILLALADFRSTCGPGLQVGRKEAEQNLFELLRNFSVFQVVTTQQPRYLDGTQLMKLLGIKPGPIIGNLLEDLLEAQTLGEVKSLEEAASLARKLYREKYCR